MPAVYLTDPGTRLVRRGLRLGVQTQGTLVTEIPVRRIDRVVLFGATGLTVPAMDLLLEHQIPVFFLSPHGRVRGILESPKAPDILFRYGQFQVFQNPDRALDLAKRVVEGKIQNQRRVLQRIQKNRPHLDLSKEIRALNLFASLVEYRQGFSSLRGLEGRATHHYFQGFRKALPPGWTFVKRTRRPPRDPTNSLLSLGYTLLTTELFSWLRVHGFDPYLGFFHRIRFGRPALALDLAEEFRHPVIDLLVLDLISHHRLKQEDFEETSEGGWYLTKRGRTVFFRQYEQRMNHRLKGPDGRRHPLRKILEFQVIRLKRAVGQDEPYRPFVPP